MPAQEFLRRRRVLLALVAAFPLIPVGGGTAQPIQQIADSTFILAARQARLIFAGSVLSADSGSLRVLVTQVLRSPRAVRNFADKVVRVVPKDSMRRDSGARAVFFAYGLSLGRTMSVREVLRVDLTSSSTVDAVMRQLARADSVNADVAMRERVSAADAVIVGRIDSLQRVPITAAQAPLRSEHAPPWRIAWVQVTGSFLQRDANLLGRMIRVLVAQRRDLTTTSPNSLETGQRRILLLRSASRIAPYNRVGIDAADMYYAFVPEYARALSDSERVARVIRSVSKSPR